VYCARLAAEFSFRLVVLSRAGRFSIFILPFCRLSLIDSDIGAEGNKQAWSEHCRMQTPGTRGPDCALAQPMAQTDEFSVPTH
jgi:hypothetical protein